MKVDVERLEKSTVALDVEVGAEKVDEAVARAFRRLVNAVDVPGFRRGKAPRMVLERHVGRPRLMNEAFKIVFPEVYRDAVKEAGIEPVDDPDVEDFDIEEGKPLKVKVRVAVKPEVELGEYRSVKHKREEVSVTPEEIDAEIENLRNRQAQLVVDESGEVKDDSYAIVDFQGYSAETGEELPHSGATDFPLAMNAGFFLPGFEDQIKGAKKGEVREVNVSLPDDYGDKELAGKAAMFKVTVKEVKKKELPALDDEFAKTQGEFATLQELKNEIANRLKQVKEQRAKAAHEEAVLKEVTDQAKVELPEVMVMRRAQSLLEDLLTRLERSQIPLQAYLQSTGQTEESLKQELIKIGERKVKTELVLEAIAAKEEIKVEESEVKKMVEGLAKSANRDADRLFEELKASGTIRGFERALMNDKVVALLSEVANTNAG